MAAWPALWVTCTRRCGPACGRDSKFVRMMRVVKLSMMAQGITRGYGAQRAPAATGCMRARIVSRKNGTEVLKGLQLGVELRTNVEFVRESSAEFPVSYAVAPYRRSSTVTFAHS